MANLAALKPKDTYQVLLQAPGWDASSTVTVELGDGTATPLSISPTGVKVNGVSVLTTASSVVGTETPTGSVNGSNATFNALHDFIPESVTVLVNGLALLPTDEFVTSGARTVVLAFSPAVGETVRLTYMKAAA